MSRWRFTSLRPLLERALGSSSGSVVSRSSARLDASRHVHQLHAEQIRLLFEQLPSALIATAIVGGLVAYVLWSDVPRLWLVTWLFGLAVTTLARVWLLRAYERAKPSASEIHRWRRCFLAGVVISGVIWGI